MAALPPVAPPFPPPCPDCGATTVWHDRLAQFGCDRCRKLLGPVAQDRARPVAPPQPQTQAAPFCPTCWTPGTWHPQAQQFGCDKCRTMLKPAPPGAPLAPPGAITNPHHMKSDAGSAVGKVVLWIVVIVVIVMIKLAIRGAL